MIIDELLTALDDFESRGKPAKAIFVGSERMQQIRQVMKNYRAAVAAQESNADTFLGLPVRGGDFPPQYIGFADRD